jgi:hypothetical protein
MAASGAEASITQISSAAALGSALDVNWSVFGSVPGNVSTFAQETVGPLTVHINTASGELALDKGSAVGGFLASNTLLAQEPGDLSDPVLVGFSAPVRGVGTQIESLLPGGFTGIMDLFDAADDLLGEITINATTTSLADGSAPFIGAISDSADIDFVIFSVDNGNPNFPKAGDVAINDMLVAVPEPATATLLGFVTLGLLGAARRRGRPTV